MKYPKISSDFFERSAQLQTPAVVYHFNVLDDMINMLKKDASSIPNLDFCFSIKANRNLGINRKLASELFGADIASFAELDVAVKAGYKKIFIHSPGFGKEDIEFVYNQGYIFDFNSFSQLQICREFLKGKEIGIRLKIEENFTGRESYGEHSRFGISLNDENVIRFVSDNNIKIKHLHVHTGEKNILDFGKTLEFIKNQINENRKILENVTLLNLGGGLAGIYFVEKQQNIFWEMLKDNSPFFEERNIKLILEPGMFMTLLCGFLITNVQSSEIIDGVNNVILNCSRFNLFQWTNTMPLYMTSEKKVALPHNFYGNTCYEHDVFSLKTVMNQAVPNDKIIFSSAGAYMTSMQRTLHGVQAPKEYTFHNNSFQEC